MLLFINISKSLLTYHIYIYLQAADCTLDLNSICIVHFYAKSFLYITYLTHNYIIIATHLHLKLIYIMICCIGRITFTQQTYFSITHSCARIYSYIINKLHKPSNLKLSVLYVEKIQTELIKMAYIANSVIHITFYYYYYFFYYCKLSLHLPRNYVYSICKLS